MERFLYAVTDKFDLYGADSPCGESALHWNDSVTNSLLYSVSVFAMILMEG